MLYPMRPNGMQAWIAENHHQPRRGGRIALEDRLDVFADRGEEVHRALMIARVDYEISCGLGKKARSACIHLQEGLMVTRNAWRDVTIAPLLHGAAPRRAK